MNTPDKKKRQPNRLSQEKSPYLLQHAYNPVNWYPWGYAHFLSGIDFMLGSSREIVIAGKVGHADTEAMLSAVRRAYMPGTTVVFHPDGRRAVRLKSWFLS
jgi:uncharacterized protein YyaL (SSP411 family)